MHSSENPVYLQEGLSDMLMARFRQGGVFELKEIKDPSQSTTELEEAVATARDADGDFVLFGSFTRFGAGASLDMQAATTALGGQGDAIREIFVHSGSIAEVIIYDEVITGAELTALTSYINGKYFGTEAPPPPGPPVADDPTLRLWMRGEDLSEAPTQQISQWVDASSYGTTLEPREFGDDS
ncbi:MAG: hypothetical protein HRU37_09370, partial [Roseibacillus sp.]|nr:hypothetical protein [Roseibacillus sp.]